MSDISQKKLEAILKLDKDKRLKHFVKQVCNWDEVWALWDGDWVFSESSEGMEFFQVWPNEIYAKLYCVGEWEDCQPASIKLDDFLESFLRPFQEEKIKVGVFYLTTENGWVMEAGYLGHLITEELNMYYR